MMKNKKNLPWLSGILILIIICSLCVGTGSAIVEDSPYIAINPVGDHAIGDIIKNFVTIHDTWDQNNHLIQDGN